LQVLDLHNEVETMIATPVGPAATISSDDAEFEQELSDLLNEAEDAGPPEGGTPAVDIYSKLRHNCGLYDLTLVSFRIA
jgi:hypothetical protein